MVQAPLDLSLQGWRVKETDEELTQRKKNVCAWGRGTIQEGSGSWTVA